MPTQNYTETAAFGQRIYGLKRRFNVGARSFAQRSLFSKKSRAVLCRKVTQEVAVACPDPHIEMSQETCASCSQMDSQSVHLAPIDPGVIFRTSSRQDRCHREIQNDQSEWAQFLHRAG